MHLPPLSKATYYLVKSSDKKHVCPHPHLTVFQRTFVIVYLSTSSTLLLKMSVYVSFIIMFHHEKRSSGQIFRSSLQLNQNTHPHKKTRTTPKSLVDEGTKSFQILEAIIIMILSTHIIHLEIMKFQFTSRTQHGLVSTKPKFRRLRWLQTVCAHSVKRSNFKCSC